MLRWQLEVTFQEVRTHLGMETQRQWSDLSVARTTPNLLGLFSWTTLAAHSLQKHHPLHPAYRRLVRQAVADFRGCHRPSTPAPVAGVRGFLTVGRRPRRTGTPRHSVPPTCRFPCLRRLKCGKSSLALASGRILFFALRHGPKPLMVDYRTGDVWLYDESAGK